MEFLSDWRRGDCLSGFSAGRDFQAAPGRSKKIADNFLNTSFLKRENPYFCNPFGAMISLPVSPGYRDQLSEGEYIPP